jgi:outer membrane protein insertion porin family
VRLCFASSLIGGSLALLSLAASAGAEERRSVAILPVVVHAREDQAYLRDGLADMLASRLGQQPGIGVIRVDDPGQGTLDPSAARAAAQAVGAQWVLFGSFTRFGEGASLDMQCLPVAAPGEPGPRSIFVQSAQITDLIPRLDGLAERVALHVLGRDGAGPATPVAGRAELDELRRRIDALERQRAASTAAAPQPQPEAQP